MTTSKVMSMLVDGMIWRNESFMASPWTSSSLPVDSGGTTVVMLIRTALAPTIYHGAQRKIGAVMIHDRTVMSTSIGRSDLAWRPYGSLGGDTNRCAQAVQRLSR